MEHQVPHQERTSRGVFILFSGCFFYYEHLRLQRKEQTRENVGDASKVGCFQMRVVDLRRRHRVLRTTPPRSAGNRFVHPLECSCPTLCSRQRRLGLTRSSDATGGSKVNRGSSGHLRQPAANPPRQRCSHRRNNILRMLTRRRKVRQ